MNRKRPQITFDSNLAAVPGTRAFWGTLCEEIGQRLVLTPTAATEVVRRVQLESEREWEPRLKKMNASLGLGWSKKEIRRLETTAGNAARNHFKEEMRHQGTIYGTTPKRSPEVETLEAEIADRIDERAFDLTTAAGLNDKKIVIEALARGYDILASNNINSIDHGLVRDWIKEHGGPELSLTTSILRPEPAEELIRWAYGKPIEWTTYAAARACVTNPHDAKRAANEIAELIEEFDARGMGEIKNRIYKMTENKREFTRVLQSVAQLGTSLAMRQEQAMRDASAHAASRRAGTTLTFD